MVVFILYDNLLVLATCFKIKMTEVMTMQPTSSTIRERITFGRKENLVSPQALNNLFLRLRKVLDQSIHKEHGYLSHFEVYERATKSHTPLLYGTLFSLF